MYAFITANKAVNALRFLLNVTRVVKINIYKETLSGINLAPSILFLSACLHKIVPEGTQIGVHK